MHPVLAASIRMQTSDIVHETCKQIIHTFTEILSAEKNDDIFERFLLMPFAESFQMYMQKYFNNKNDIKFINALGNMYIEMAEYKQTIDLYNSALNIVQNNSELKEYSVELSRELGNAYKQYGDFASARKYYTATITSVSSQSECKAENKITVYRDMGHLYKSEGDYDKALHYYNWAEKIYYQAKKEDPQLSEKYLAKIYYGKGNVYRCAENFEESKKHYELARNIYKDKVDESSFEWMLTYDNIGVCWFRLGYYDKALAYHEKALELQKKTYKNIKQPFMGLSYMYRGDVYMAQKKEETAYKDYQTAFYIIQNSVGDYHPYMIRVKNHMARYFLSQNDYEQAESIERGALDFENTELGRVHPDTAELYNNLVEIYIRKRDKDNAVKYHNRLKAYKDTVLRSHPETLKLWMREAEYYISLGKGSKAYEKLRYLVQEASDITSKATIVEQAKRMMREKF